MKDPSLVPAERPGDAQACPDIMDLIVSKNCETAGGVPSGTCCDRKLEAMEHPQPALPPHLLRLADAGNAKPAWITLLTVRYQWARWCKASSAPARTLAPSE